MISGGNLCDLLVRNMKRTCKCLRMITAGKEDDCKLGCHLHYLYVRENYIKITVNISKQ